MTSYEEDDCDDALPPVTPPPMPSHTEIKTLVSARDIVTESFLQEIIDSLPEPPHSSAVELAREWKEEAKKRITGMSVTLSHRVQPLVQLMLEQKLAQNMDKSFSTIQVIEPPIFDMAKKYRRCFNTWIDASNCVSFKATNVRLLGKVNVKDVYILTFFTFLTCRRAKNDNILQLGMVGSSTVGKSTLFESCLNAGSHVTTNESGVGRYQVNNKPLLMFQDVSIRTLAMSKDTEKIKTIARTEPTVTKIHSTTYTLPPLFLFYSSNERLMSHKFDNPPPDKKNFCRLYPSQVNSPGKKQVSDELLLAVQNRFIEAFVREAPPLNQADLPQSGGFQQTHAILGMFKRVIGLMHHYQPTDFYSPVLIQYVLQGLCANCKLHTEVMNCNVDMVLKLLVAKHLSPELQPTLLKLL